MTEQRQDRGLHDAISTALGEQAAQERYRSSQRQPRPAAKDRPRPLEFDERGFPLPQTPAKLASRVARLLRIE